MAYKIMSPKKVKKRFRVRGGDRNEKRRWLFCRTAGVCPLFMSIVLGLTSDRTIHMNTNKHTFAQVFEDSYIQTSLLDGLQTSLSLSPTNTHTNYYQKKINITTVTSAMLDLI